MRFLFETMGIGSEPAMSSTGIVAHHWLISRKTPTENAWYIHFTFKIATTQDLQILQSAPIKSGPFPNQNNSKPNATSRKCGKK
jgi:hypothetical protein